MALLGSLQFSFIVGRGDEHAALQAPGFNQRGIEHGSRMPYEKLLKGHNEASMAERYSFSDAGYGSIEQFLR